MQKLKNILISLVLLFITLSLILYFINNNKVTILGYHGVLPNELNTSNDNFIVDRETFEKQLKTLKVLGYKTMTLDEFYCWKENKCKKDYKSVLITFDDGYLNNYQYAFDLLKKYDMNAVVFIIGSSLKENNDIHINEEIINKTLKEYPNIEFASHSYNLHYKSDKTYDIVNEDIKKMPIKSKYYAYPYGEYTEDYIKALKDNGYVMAFGFGPGKEHRKASISDNNYIIPRLNISKDLSLIKFIIRLILPL